MDTGLIYRLLSIPVTLLFSVTFDLQMAKIPVEMPTGSAQIPPQDRTSQASQLYQVGVGQYRQGELQKALETFQRSLVLVANGKPQDKANILNYIGQIYHSLGQDTKAISFYQQAIAILKQTGDRTNEGITLSKIGLSYQSLGQYSKALKFYSSGLAIFKQVGDKSPDSLVRTGEGITLTDIGGLYKSLGEYPKALRFLEQGLAISREVRNRSGEGVALRNIGEVYDDLEQYPKAISFLEPALKIAKQDRDRSEEAATLLSLGRVYNNQGQEVKALNSYQQVLTISQKLGYRRIEGATLHEMGTVYQNLKQYPKALKLYQQVLAITIEQQHPPAEALTRTSLGSTLLQTGQAAAAAKMLLTAINIWESLRPGLTDVYKVSIFESQAQTYRQMQQALIAQGKNNYALEIAERGRSKAFVELLTLRLSPNSQNPPNIKPLTIDQIKLIAKKEKATLVEYSIVSDKLLYIWVVQPTGIVSFKQVNLTSTPLTELVRSSRNSLGLRGRGIPTNASIDAAPQVSKLKQLHKLLIEPIAKLLPTDPNQRVIFIPQNELFLVPFPALKDQNDKYLIEKHTILTAPAIQVLQLTREKRERLGGGTFASLQGKDALVVGNPTMPSIITKSGEKPQQLATLPGAEAEAIEVAKLLKTKAMTGKVATKASILQQMKKARVIHLATHGLLDDFKGLGVPGAIALAPDNTGQINDGLLTADEILNLNLNAVLVILSACDTGEGRITGDGVVGLSRSLISAGASSVIVSLWAVSDDSTEFLMTRFYENLRQNPDQAVALRNAMLTTMKQYSRPLDWAAFTLIGEP
ncbi:CHAT domain-containing tetratricopeptide repeat protein [Plectonema radiosum NIES-515]|uniref:CHAT domain-containing tetratricopeptide repeat protein n=1 Tax=Plectonema radiosum NIES-515 TaxID=2986073 RepID=A0ABT3AZH6_9CYAN|nr:CHAT domain-containing tetratricopeptide repeat protein [Plectonema radiosum]MCV3214532.1 CHAT domain-containing tetratricopeptide repeat protein [Plectonema radiosum NIES-515]